MSFTETQVIHNLSQSPSRSIVGSFILGNTKTGIEGDDKGLIMTLDSKLGDVIKPINVLPPPPPSRIPVVTSHQFCGLSSLSGWLLRALSYFQNAHLAIVSFTNNMDETIQKKVAHILPLFLYLSLLVLAVQGVVIMVLLAQSLLPLGMWFLMTCISCMGGIFCSTSVITEYDKPYAKRTHIE
ncbi:uncharacterized protein LOC110847498 [Folsomia candida]|uniref:Uncharacterized protein n=1 Tax=Folsomia candida TaxID=158441 RepID=A0A226ELI5_FOLCA|nr:uncharacterized protein LOC110847498 [Folsomia candida]OXA58492.1 hypothetical protein Fcan01_07949 [Folsomia candida]